MELGSSNANIQHQGSAVFTGVDDQVKQIYGPNNGSNNFGSDSNLSDTNKAMSQLNLGSAGPVFKLDLGDGGLEESKQ